MYDNLGKNYDVEHRISIERQIIGTVIALYADDNIRKSLQNHNIIVSDFYLKIHQEIIEGIFSCFEQNLQPTLSAVSSFRPAHYRQNNEADYYKALVNITQTTLWTSNALDYNLFMLKQYILYDFWNTASTDLLYGNWNGRDVLMVGDSVILRYQMLFKRLTEKLTVEKNESFEAKMISKVEKHTQGLLVGIPSAIEPVDDFTGGWSFGEFVVLAGRPGMGKTTIALISAWQTAKMGFPVTFYSLEMDKDHLKMKIISMETGISYGSIKNGRLTEVELDRVLQVDRQIESSCFFIIDKIKTIEEIIIKSKEMREVHNCRLFILDYIQRCGSVMNLQTRELTTLVTRECKGIAKDNEACFIGLSQLNRAVETRPNKRPRLSDLKESSSVEEDADIVIFLFRQAYYDTQQGEVVSYNEEGHTEFIFAKGRDIGTRTIHLFVDLVQFRVTAYDFTA